MKTKMKKYQAGGRTVNQVRKKGTDPLSYYSPAKKSGSGNLIPVTSVVAQGLEKGASTVKTPTKPKKDSKPVKMKTGGTVKGKKK